MWKLNGYSCKSQNTLHSYTWEFKHWIIIQHLSSHDFHYYFQPEASWTPFKKSKIRTSTAICLDFRGSNFWCVAQVQTSLLYTILGVCYPSWASHWGFHQADSLGVRFFCTRINPSLWDELKVKFYLFEGHIFKIIFVYSHFKMNKSLLETISIHSQI